MTSGDRSPICGAASFVANSGECLEMSAISQPADPGLDESRPLFHKARNRFRDERLERRLNGFAP